MRHFRVVHSGIDVEPLLGQLRDHPELWSTETEWTRKKAGAAVYDTENIVLRYLTLGLTPVDKRLFLYEAERDRDNWTRPVASMLFEAWPIVFDLMRAIPGEHLGHVIITRLPPRGEVRPHFDKWPAELGPPYWQRHQVPLQSSLGCVFRCGDEELYMQPGCAYWFDNQQEHSVVNESGEERISMIVHIRPFSSSVQ